ncbi:FecR domain-containing protein [Parapedobacter sp. ISTM3]|uniref:FecR family protein n=1 Tax=Parapedobacter sp. ISTM3 TaxID=2800130 RepID=UPI0019075C46|nr:FecR domain-containing protein [Parapedobacter sp. ISTM3]MBK1441865.1 FecR domain-containing protein [Parapedobacter sp. ISTM3]
MQQDELRDLLRRYANGNCTPQEKRFLEDLILRHPIAGDWDWNSEEERVLMGIRIKQAVDGRRSTQKHARMKIRWYSWIAAASLVILGAGVIWRLVYPDTDDSRQPLVINESVLGSTSDIVLTLADGRTVKLDEQSPETIASIEGTTIRRNADGLVYEVDDRYMQPGSVGENNIRTPNGKRINLKLPDGTAVWMNTASSLTYPVAFVGKERRVELTGEAYFEVAKDNSKPFKVMANGTEILVTGTHFNISAYPTDGTVTTTLFEGGLNVRKGRREVVLTPGYQAITSVQSEKIEQLQGKLEQVMAWKNGYFVFDDMDVVSVMRSVARWYDIRITVEGKMPAKRFGGTFPISADLDELLTDLELVGKMKLERNGKEVHIMW